MGSPIPIYFAGNRENTNIGLESLAGQSFHLAAFFARRPKIQEAGSFRIEGKINARIFRVAKFASRLGIPVFSGISLTNNIFDQATASPLWFDVSGFHDEEDFTFTCEVDETFKLRDFAGRIQPANDLDILSRICDSRSLDWEEATRIMSELPKTANYPTHNNYSLFSQTWRMKPVYIAIRKS